MDYKTSLSIFHSQCINVRQTWDAKSVYIKSLTNYLREISDDELNEFTLFMQNNISALKKLKAEIDKLNKKKSKTSSETEKESYQQNIIDKKLTYIKKHNISKSYYLKNIHISSVISHTKILVLMYCTWSEANFLKLIHTPHGFELSEKQQITGRNIEAKWEKLIEVTLNKIPSIPGNTDIEYMKEELTKVVKEYIVNPSEVRNKIMHGQWDIGLTSKADAFDVKNTIKIYELDFTKVEFWFDVQKQIVRILELIIEANNKTDMIMERKDSFLYEWENLKKLILKKGNWTLKTRIDFLKQRKGARKIIDIAKILKENNVDDIIITKATGVKQEKLNNI